ncbi:hypothetical protein HDU76_007319 [Blyttiomyces sp. JEL0837]|nr:hypothetical protein HDU76_007319 [Blyttiomyces sp. JEL0837]
MTTTSSNETSSNDTSLNESFSHVDDSSLALSTNDSDTDSNSLNSSDINVPKTLIPSTTGGVYTLNGKKTAIDYFHLYMHRGDALKDMNFVIWRCCISIELKKPPTTKKKTHNLAARFPFRSGCILANTHVQQIKSKLSVPEYTGKSFPSMPEIHDELWSDTERIKAEIFGQYVLAAFDTIDQETYLPNYPFNYDGANAIPFSP